MLTIKRSVLVSFPFILVGCAANSLASNAKQVQVTTKEPSAKCKFIDTITESQGNFFTGGFTSNNNLQKGAYNKLRNEAAKAGGNYVQIISNQAGNTGSMGANGGAYQQTNYSVTGSVYNCPL